jgi:hypothetical protein
VANHHGANLHNVIAPQCTESVAQLRGIRRVPCCAAALFTVLPHLSVRAFLMVCVSGWAPVRESSDKV